MSLRMRMSGPPRLDSRIIIPLDEEYKSWRFSLCSFLNAHNVISIWHPNNLDLTGPVGLILAAYAVAAAGDTHT
jgi:hypothetical protein